jgi:G3E family GTPase
MSFKERTTFVSFVENRKEIENDWHKTWGDRKNELVFIGQEMEKAAYLEEIESCLLTEEEIILYKTGGAFHDPFPEVI